MSLSLPISLRNRQGSAPYLAAVVLGAGMSTIEWPRLTGEGAGPPYGGPPWQPQQPGDPQYPTQPHSGDPHGRRARSPKHRHRVHNVILSIIGLIIVLVAIGTALSGGKSPGKPAAVPSTPSAPPAAANTGLTALQQQFV